MRIKSYQPINAVSTFDSHNSSTGSISPQPIGPPPNACTGRRHRGRCRSTPVCLRDRDLQRLRADIEMKEGAIQP